MDASDALGKRNETPRVIRSAIMGFCSGVRLAVKAAEDALGRNSDGEKKIFSLGPLIHNETVLKDLEDNGLSILDENQIDSLDENCVVLLRAHGVAPSVLKKINATGAQVIDSTCPRVATSLRRAEEFSKEGCHVILAGDAGHGEVRAIQGSAEQGGGKFTLVQNADEARSFADSFEKARDENCVLLSQTTFSPEEFKKISGVLREKIPDLQVLDTICPATQSRQRALLDLSEKVEAIVVVGGKKSANTRRLFELARSLCEKSFFVEGAREMERLLHEGALCGVTAIGITAGASTPDFLIGKVEDVIIEN